MSKLFTFLLAFGGFNLNKINSTQFFRTLGFIRKTFAKVHTLYIYGKVKSLWKRNFPKYATELLVMHKMGKILTFGFLVFMLSSGVHAQSVDSDGDGIVDSIDLDDDNDGILDSHEVTCFTNIVPKVD